MPRTLTVRGTCEGAGAVEKYDATFCYPVSLERSQIEALQARRTHGCSVLYARGLTIAIQGLLQQKKIEWENPFLLWIFS